MSAIAIIVGVIAISISIPYVEIINESYIGWVVAVLSTIILLLIGWQIFDHLRFRGYIEEVNNIKKEVEAKTQIIIYEADRSALLSCIATSDFYYELLVETPLSDKEFKFLQYRISALLNASKIKDYGYCNAIVKALLENIVEDQLQMTAERKKQLADLLLSVKEQHNIQNYRILLQKILNLRETPKSFAQSAF